MALECSNIITARVSDSEWREIAAAFEKKRIDWPSTLDGVSITPWGREISCNTRHAPTPWEEGYMRQLSRSYPSALFHYVTDIQGEDLSPSAWFCNGREGDQEEAESDRIRAYHQETERFLMAAAQAADGVDHRVELMPDGRVAADGENRFGECNIFKWKNIRAISCGNWHTVGLREDGTLVACGSNANGQCDVSDLEEKATAVSCGRYHTAILLESGKVIVRGALEQPAWPPVAKIVSVFDAVIGITADGEVFIDGFCPGAEAVIEGLTR